MNEIERKFLVTVPRDQLRPVMASSESAHIDQGYLAEGRDAVVRVRAYGDEGFITVKSSTDKAWITKEVEYKIDFGDALELLELCRYRISKTRYRVASEDGFWDLDVYHQYDDLITAEFEHKCEETVMNVSIPWWVGLEVTENKGYSNYSLAMILGERNATL